MGIALLVNATVGLRVSEVQAYEGMDRSEHGENAYPMELWGWRRSRKVEKIAMSEEIALETGGAASTVPALPNEPESKPEPEPANRILPQPDQDRTLAEAVAHYRSVLPPDGTVDGDEDPVDYAEQFRSFEAESGF